MRGDYTRTGPDFVIEQDWSAYTSEEHALYRRLFVIESFEQLLRETAPDFTPIYERVRSIPMEVA